MSFKDQINNLGEIRAIIMLRAPRDGKGDLGQPYKRWIAQLDKDILRAEILLGAMGPNYKPATEIVVGRPSEPQETVLAPGDSREWLDHPRKGKSTNQRHQKPTKKTQPGPQKTKKEKPCK